jgi:ribonuclease HI
MHYYAVANGRKKGVFSSWAEAKEQVEDFPNARYKKFENVQDAHNFVKGGGSLILGQLGVFMETPVSTQSTSSPFLPDTLVAFTDGACIHNGKRNAKASWAVVFPNHVQYNRSGLCVGQQTNNRAEYTALCKAQELADQIDPQRKQKLIVYTDSQLLRDSMTKWLPSWKRNGWKKSTGDPVLNRDLLERIDAMQQLRRIEIHHVRAHTGRQDWMSKWNDTVDKLAKEALHHTSRIPNT